MYASEFPSCCALQVIEGASLLGSTDAWSKKEAAQLNDIVRGEDQYDPDSNQGSLLTLADADPEHYARAAKFLKTKGWKLLGTVPGAHCDVDGEYRVYLWGSSSFKVPVRTKRK